MEGGEWRIGMCGIWEIIPLEGLGLGGGLWILESC